MKSCVSVAVANSLFWLAENGHDNIVIRDESGTVNYSRTVQVLDRMLKPTTDSGASPPTLARGLERYLAVQGYSPEDYQIELQVWYHPEGELLPNLARIKKGILGKSAVWLFVGFYTIDENNNEYQVISHHYVTLVGYGVEEDGRENPNILIVHDPAPRSGPGITHNYVKIEAIEARLITVGDQQLTPQYPQLPFEGAGYYKLGDGLAYNPYADLAILDGVIILEMK